MDQYLSTVIIAVITGVFSVITLLIQKKQDKVVSKIDEQTLFIAQEKEIKKKINKKEAERELLIHEIMILILDTNIHILKNIHTAGESSTPSDEVMKTSEILKERFNTASDEIDELTKQYELILNLSEEYEKEYKKPTISKK